MSPTPTPHQLNLQAIQLIQTGHLNEALSVLRAALSAVAAIDHQQQQQQQRPTDECSSSACPPVRSVPVTESFSLADKTSCDQAHHQHHAFKLFDRALHLQETATADVTCLTQNNNNNALLSATILYNMGLIFHLTGMQDIGLQTSCLDRALGIYKMAFSILEKYDNSCSTTGMNMNMHGLLYLAVLNNMGHIFSQFCQSTSVQGCIDWIRYILARVEKQLQPVAETTTTAGAQQTQQQQQGNDYYLFRMNVIALHGKSKVAAAAA